MSADNVCLLLCVCRDKRKILGYYDTCLDRIFIAILVLVYALRHFHRIVLGGAVDRSLNRSLCGLRGCAVIRIIAIHSINIPLCSKHRSRCKRTNHHCSSNADQIFD